MAEDETGKSKKARHRVEVIGKEQVKAVTEKLKKARGELFEVVKKTSNPTETDKAPVSNLERIEFNCNEACFYIDFCLVSDDDHLEGAIVYGALRAPRYPYSLWGSKKIKENRPLFSLSVDEYGKISAKGKLDDEWYFKSGAEKEEKENEKKENEKALKEMHYRVLDLVWRDALNWGNEALLP